MIWKRLLETYGKPYEEIKNDFDGVEVNHDEINRIGRWNLLVL